MTNLKGSLVSQTANDVHDVMHKIAQCDFSTGLYGYTSIDKGIVIWVGFAQHGDGHRFFTIHDAHTPKPTLQVLSKDQSMMHSSGEIGEVDVNDIDYEVTLEALICRNFPGVIDLLGLSYLAADFARIRSKAVVSKMPVSKDTTG